MEMRKSYVLIHFWPTEGGFHKRIHMLLDVLRKKTSVCTVRTFADYFRFLFSEAPAVVLLYTSLMAPCAAIIRIARPEVPICYMIRGDEVSYVMKRGRRFRAFIAVLFQRFLRRLGCHFVFVCEDLRVLFEERLGPIPKASVLPNTIGKPLPPSRPFDGRVALVGDFHTVKNTEWALHSLARGRFEVHLFGNRSVPAEWARPWLHSHGVITDMVAGLREHATALVLPYIDAGFPNILVEALEAGCNVLVHRDFPFKHLPIGDDWRFDLTEPRSGGQVEQSQLEMVLGRLQQEQRLFTTDNPALVQLIESDWEERVWRILG